MTLITPMDCYGRGVKGWERLAAVWFGANLWPSRAVLPGPSRGLGEVSGWAAESRL